MICPSAHNPPHVSPTGCPISPRAQAFNPFESSYQHNPAGTLKWARDEEPVFFSPELGYWVVTRYQDVKAVFRDNLLFSPANALEKITPASEQALAILKDYGYAMNRTMVNEDEPDHMVRRRLLMDAFLPERLVTFEPTIRGLVRQRLDQLQHQGHADLVKEVFYEIPLTIALQFLGVPDEGAEQLRQFAVAHTLNTWGKPTPQEQLAVATQVGKFWQTAQGIVDEMMAQPQGQGWMYDTIAQHRQHPTVVTESYVRSMMMAILAAAHETTSNATANAFMTLLTHRHAWEDICAHPALIPNAVEECLRVAGSIIAWRRVATADTHIGGVAIPKGGKLLLAQASANCDERHFENPEQMDLYRENAVEHLSFGYGSHQCMGKNIGRMQMRIFLEEFTQRLPDLALVPGQTFDFLSNTSFRGPSQLWVRWDPAHTCQTSGPALGSAPTPFQVGPPARDGIARHLVIRQREQVGSGLVRLVLSDANQRPLPAWTAGSHIDLIAGGYRRKYSLCGTSTDINTYEVVIRREPQGRGGSAYLCDQLRVGDTLQVAGPKNLFRLDESAKRYVLIAGGIGITPLIAMADRLRARGLAYEIHYAGASEDRMALLGRLKQDHGSHLHTYVSKAGQRLALDRLLSTVNAQDRIYACGPTRLIAALQAMAQHWPEGVFHCEHFSADLAQLDPAIEHAFDAILQDSKITVPVPAHLTLLQALQSAGVDVPFDCGEGLCGTCEVAVVAGEADHRDKVLSPPERAAQQRMMACCSRAVGRAITLAL